MKRWTLLFFVIFFASLTSISFARSSVAEYKNPEINLADIDLIIVEPIIYGPEAVVDDFTHMRLEAAFQEGFYKFPVPLHFQTEDQAADLNLKVMPVRMIIYVKKFTWDNYQTDGHYESYTRGSTSIIDDYYWTRDGRRRYWGSRPFFESRTYYVQPEEKFQARAEVQITLQSLDEKTTYWIYNQERFDTKRSSPDQSLKTIIKEAKEHFEKSYKKDLKALTPQKSS